MMHFNLCIKKQQQSTKSSVCLYGCCNRRELYLKEENCYQGYRTSRRAEGQLLRIRVHSASCSASHRWLQVLFGEKQDRANVDKACPSFSFTPDHLGDFLSLLGFVYLTVPRWVSSPSA